MSDIDAILRMLDRELWLVTASHQGARAGLIATFVCNASIVPEMPRMLIGIAKQHHTWGLTEASRAFALTLIDESHLDWVWRFGLASGRAGDKFAGLTTAPSDTGSPLLTEAIAWLDCRVETSLDTGDRTVYLAEVLAGKVQKATKPLTLQRLLQLAPAERLQELRAGLERDAIIDAAAIRRWRESKST